jgi:hypothetical protein
MTTIALEEKKVFTTESKRRKQPKTVRLFLPVFFDDTPASDSTIQVPLSSILSGNALYGDIAKEEGLATGLEYSKKKKKVMRVVDLSLALRADVQGGMRPSEQDIQDGKTSMIRLERHAIKFDFMATLEGIVNEAGGKKFPYVKNKTLEEWLEIDASLAGAIFNAYPLDLIVTHGKVPYTEEPVAVGIINPECVDSISAAVLFYGKMKVKINKSL